MSNLSKYKNLVKDTLSLLERSDIKFTDSFTDFFKKDIQNTKKKSISQKVDLLEKKKYNIGPVQQLPKYQKPPLPHKDAQKTQDATEIKKDTPKPIAKKTNQIQTDKTFVVSKEPKPPQPTKKIILNDKLKIFEDSFSDIKKDILEIFPHISFKNPLDDKIAKQKSQKYKLKNIAANITVLAYKENENFYKFLEKLSIALDVCFYPSKVVSAYLIEKENNWDVFLSQKEIFLIISSDYTIFELPNLRRHYKENPSLLEKYLNDIPLFLLPDISLYFKEPTLKSSLFKALKQKILDIKK